MPNDTGSPFLTDLAHATDDAIVFGIPLVIFIFVLWWLVWKFNNRDK